MLEALQTERAKELAHTLPGRLYCHAAHSPDRTALVEKDLGLWRPVSWAEYRDQVRYAAAALQAWGLGRGDRIAILSDNRTEWLYADLGAQAIGAISAGIYQTNPPADVAYVIRHSHCQVVFCEDQEQVDKLLEVLPELDMVRHVVVFDPRGTQDYDEPRLVDWQSFIAAGREAAAPLDQFREQLAALDAAAPCMIIYTSGTTGQPKGALLSAASLLPITDVSVTALDSRPDDQLLSYLPLCHVAEKIFSVFTPLSTGSVVHFGESIETIQEDLVAVAPTAFLGVPRIWEKLNAAITVRMRDASWLKRHLYQQAMRIGVAIAPRERAGKASATDKLLRWLADALVFSALRERIGLNRARLAASGAAPIAPELLEWFWAIGVPILEGFGMTETSGLCTLNLVGAYKIGTVGRALPTIELRTAEDGELLVRGSNVFQGYLGNAEATAESIDAEGWLHTGDLASIDEDGFVAITGRKKEIFITAGGKNISPNHIENTLKISPYIKEVASIGDARPFVSALIQIEADLVGNWAMRAGVAFTSFTDLAANERVYALIRDEVQKLNERLPRVEQVKSFRLLPKELHQDDGEVTATQKLRRKVVYEKFSGLIDEMYQ